MIAAEAHPDASIIWGVSFDPELDDEMKITIIATGFAESYSPVAEPAPVVEEKPAAPAPAPAAKPTVKTAPAVAAQPKAEPAPAKDDEDMDMDDIMGLFRANGGRGTTRR
jgi:cell division protein FtsZ